MKILVIRFSSIGDIVLCSPVFRCLKKQKNAEIHWLTKSSFKSINEFNPYIDKIHCYDKKINELITPLKEEQFDLVVDLQKNLKSTYISLLLRAPLIRFDKLNLQKWLMTQFKINILPKKHLVDRYFEALSKIHIVNDGEGLDFFIDPKVNQDHIIRSGNFIVGVLGAAHFTKMIPYTKWCEWFLSLKHEQIVLIGGKQEMTIGEELQSKFPDNVRSLAGKLSIAESAAYIRQCKFVISPDTGFMHIAAALKKRIISVWGNTIPEFGMFPYYGRQNIPEIRMQLESLSCRPCSKIGYDACPKGHFKCMNLQSALPDIEETN